MAACIKCYQKLTTKTIGEWLPGEGMLCYNCANQDRGRAIISLDFKNGNCRESANVVLACDRAGFMDILESLVSEIGVE